MKPWTVKSSHITYRDRWMTLRTDECVTARGHVLTGYHILEWPDWINVVALTADGEAILVREYRHGAQRVIPGLPSGVIETKDANALSTAQRELAEETGYGGGAWTELAETWANPAVQTNRIWTYLAFPVAEIGGIELDPGEDIEVYRKPFDRLVADLRHGRLKFQAYHVAAVHAAALHVVASREAALQPLRERLLAELGVRP